MDTTIQEQQLAMQLAKNPATDAVMREYSYGNGKSMAHVGRTGYKLSWTITNTLLTDKVIAIASQNVVDRFSASDFGADAFLITGDQLVDTGKKINVVSRSNGRVIEHFLHQISHASVQIASLQIKSENASTSAGEVSNYNNEITSIWFSPFQQQVEDVYPLRDLQDGKLFSPEFVKADFLADGFDAILSEEHVLLVRVNTNTALTLTAEFGAMDSRPQRFYRQVRKANAVLAPVRAGKGC